MKLNIYETIAATTKAPTSTQIAAALNSTVAEVEAAFQHLYQKRLLVLEPGTTSHIRMAPPFSGIETPHLVKIDGKSYYANCAWDALGVAAALHRDAGIESVCADCGEPMSFQVRDGRPLPQDCAIHFAVPAAHWWDDIIYT
ncbi:MAG TPA: organomercurial lyase [Anaerolineae bacterium]